MKTNYTALVVLAIVIALVAGGAYYFLGLDNTLFAPSIAPSQSTPVVKKGNTSGGSQVTKASGAQSFAPSLEGVSLSASLTSGAEPFTTKFSGTVPSSLNGSYTFSLIYGDGTSTPVVASCVGTACTINATHTYSISGSFDPQLSATTKCATTIPVGVDCEHFSYVIAKTPVTVTGNVASASIVVTPALLKAGDTADILVKGSGSSLVVDFGDGTSKSLVAMTNQIASVEHIYATAGTYTLKVTDGTQTIASQSVLVQ